MKNLIRKGRVEQFNYFSSFNWDYFYSAGYLLYKKIENLLSNEDNKKLYISV